MQNIRWRDCAMTRERLNDDGAIEHRFIVIELSHHNHRVIAIAMSYHRAIVPSRHRHRSIDHNSMVRRLDCKIRGPNWIPYTFDVCLATKIIEIFFPSMMSTHVRVSIL